MNDDMTEKLKAYRVNEIFYSLQGEGARAGTANIFVRFSGCNLRCTKEKGKKSPGGFDCDTEFESGTTMRLDEILDACRALSPFCRWLVLTGGEPALQVDDEFVEFFHAAEYRLAIETNGSRVVAPGVDWITVSPKVAEHAIKQLTADEVKYIRGRWQGIPRPAVDARHQFISPPFDGMEIEPDALERCIELVKENPGWALSVQSHKQWRIR